MKRFLKPIAALLALLLAGALFAGCNHSVVIRDTSPAPTNSPTQEPPRIELSATAKTLAPGESYSIFASVVPLGTAPAASFSYVSDNESVAVVNAYGVVTAVAAGSCTVTVSTEEPQLSAPIRITVDDGSAVTPTPVTPTPATPTEPVTPTPVTPTPTTPIPPEDLIPIESLELVGPTDMIAGTSVRFVVKVTPENANEPYTFHNSNTRISSMTEDGILTAFARGTTTVTVETEDQRLHDSITVEVSSNITGIMLTADADTFEVGETVKIHAEMLPEGAVSTSVWWVFSTALSSGDCTLRQEGYDCYVTATKAGSIKITCGVNDRKGVNKMISLTARPSSKPSLSLDKTSMTLEEGDSEKLTAVLLNCTGSITYSSADESVARINSSGVVTAVKEGTTIVTVTGRDGEFVKTCSVTVKKKTPVIELEKSSLTLEIGQSAQVGAILKYATGTLSYRSSNSSVVSVDSSGKLRARKAGEATITVSFTGAANVTMTVTVKPIVIKVDKSELTLNIGDETTAGATLEGASGDLTYTSSDPATVSVDSAGKITAHAAGEATVTVSFEGAESVAIAVTVKPVVIKVDKSELTLNVGDETTAGATLEGASGTLNYESADPSVASVDGAGKITAHAAGETTVTVSFEGAESVAIAVTVNEPAPPVVIHVSYTEITIENVGDVDLVEATLSGAEGTLTFISSDPDTVSVDEYGIVTGNAPGSAEITVSFEGAESVVVTVIVKGSAAEQEDG